jgi:hypothetical protein
MKLSVDLSIIQMLGEKLYSQGKAMVFVKECLQNSLDANARNISVEFATEYNIDVIKIIDDGDGIKDFQNHFATIGGSYKNKEGAIGGFGIAKLAIMAMDDWYVTSIQGTLTKDMLYNER